MIIRLGYFLDKAKIIRRENPFIYKPVTRRAKNPKHMAITYRNFVPCSITFMSRFMRYFKNSRFVAFDCFADCWKIWISLPESTNKRVGSIFKISALIVSGHYPWVPAIKCFNRTAESLSGAFIAAIFAIMSSFLCKWKLSTTPLACSFFICPVLWMASIPCVQSICSAFIRTVFLSGSRVIDDDVAIRAFSHCISASYYLDDMIPQNGSNE